MCVLYTEWTYSVTGIKWSSIGKLTRCLGFLKSIPVPEWGLTRVTQDRVTAASREQNLSVYQVSCLPHLLFHSHNILWFLVDYQGGTLDDIKWRTLKLHHSSINLVETHLYLWSIACNVRDKSIFSQHICTGRIQDAFWLFLLQENITLMWYGCDSVGSCRIKSLITIYRLIHLNTELLWWHSQFYIVQKEKKNIFSLGNWLVTNSLSLPMIWVWFSLFFVRLYWKCHISFCLIAKRKR